MVPYAASPSDGRLLAVRVQANDSGSALARGRPASAAPRQTATRWARQRASGDKTDGRCAGTADERATMNRSGWTVGWVTLLPAAALLTGPVAAEAHAAKLTVRVTDADTGAALPARLS